MLTAVNLLLRFAGTSFQVYLSGRIGPAGIGLLQLTLSVGGLAAVTAMAGVRTAAMYLTAASLGRKRPGEVTWVLSGCFLYSILCSGAVAAILTIYAPQIAQSWIGDLRTLDALRLFAAFLPTSCLCGVMTGYFTAANRIGTLAAVEVGEQLISILLTMVSLTFWAGRDPGRSCQCVILGSGLGGCLTLLCLTVLRLREHPGRSAPIPVARPLLNIAAPLALADVTKALINTGENLMVPKRLRLFPGMEDPLAAFGRLTGMVFPVLMFPACILFALAELLLPELARCAAAGSRDRIRYLVRRGLGLALLYGSLLAGGMFLLAPYLCGRLYNDAQAGTMLRLYSLLIPMLYCDTITDSMTKGLGQQKACVRYNILTSSLDVAFLYLLLPEYGLSGYFVSFFATHLLNFWLSLRRLIRITGEPLSSTLPTLALGSTAAAVLAGSCFQSPMVSVGVYFAVLLSLWTILGILDRSDVRWLKNLLLPVVAK